MSVVSQQTSLPPTPPSPRGGTHSRGPPIIQRGRRTGSRVTLGVWVPALCFLGSARVHVVLGPLEGSLRVSHPITGQEPARQGGRVNEQGLHSPGPNVWRVPHLAGCISTDPAKNEHPPCPPPPVMLKSSDALCGHCQVCLWQGRCALFHSWTTFWSNQAERSLTTSPD